MSSTTLQVVPAEARPSLSTPQLNAIGAEMRKTQELAKQHAQLAIAFAVRYGHLCEQAKAQLPHGKFETWLDEQGLPKSTAHRYRQLAKSTTMVLLPAEELTAPDFLDRVESDQTYRAELATKVKEVAGEQTVTDLMRDLQIIKKPANVDEETGKRKHYAAKKLTADEAAQEARRGALKSIQEALGTAEVCLVKSKAYRYLSLGELERADEHLSALSRKFHAIVLEVTAKAKVAKKGGRA